MNIHTVSLLSTLWVSSTSIRRWTLSRPCDIFQTKHDEVVKQLVTISCMDDLLSGMFEWTSYLDDCLLMQRHNCENYVHLGMLSKSKGQCLRVAATMHVIFNWKTPQNIPTVISDDALKAADNFVSMCVQHAAYLAGRGELSDAIENVHLLQQGRKCKEYHSN